jgi:acyl-CoA thioesterase
MGIRIPLPDPKKPRTWAQQMALEKVSDTVYKSTAGAPFGGNFVQTKGGEPRPRAFGGHVYGQALYAASKTVPKTFSIHSMTGYFTLIGLADEPFTYQIRTVRDGNNYMVRSIDVVQEDGERIVFSALCSFKKSEPGFLNVGIKKDLQKKYEKLLGGKRVEDLPIIERFKDIRLVPVLCTAGVEMLMDYTIGRRTRNRRLV